MKRFFRTALFGLLAALCGLAAAQSAPTQVIPVQAQQPHATIQSAIQEYARVQTNGLPGKATVTVGAIDPRLQLAACAAMDVFTPPGTRLWGNVSVGVRCAAPTPWTIY